MKLYKYLVIMTILLFGLGVDIVKAEACDSDDIKRLRVLASNVEITYEYNDDLYDNEGFKIYDTYKIIINNMTDELYIYESKTGTNLSSYAIKDGMITVDRMYSGKKTFKVYSKACNKSLKTHYVTLPSFNYYSTDPNCEGKDDLEVCQKFYDSSNLDYGEFLEIITKYEDGDIEGSIDVKDVENKYEKFIKDNFVYIGIGVGLFLVILVALIILKHRKRGALG